MPDFLRLSTGGTVSGGIKITDGGLNLEASSTGIKFNTKGWYVTNMQVGEDSFSLGAASGSTNSKTVAFYEFGKGSGD